MNVLANHWHDGPGAWWPIFPFLWVLFWVAVITTLVVVFRRRRGPWRPERSGESVLAERFARGEIDETEYHERLAVLRGGQS